ncbi:MAG: (2Fe-2S)-binding protein [Thaumarchaeota archaeon]|nr:(2Fe-2S)-binding protein [Nitrososphaerota archaeon]
MSEHEIKKEISKNKEQVVNDSKVNEDLELNRRSFMKLSAAGAVVVGVAGLSLKNPSLSLQSKAAGPVSPDPFASRTITLNVNQENFTLSVEPRDMLVNILRENLGLIATKRPCNRMECGGCTVLIDNVPVYACTYLATKAEGHKILTAEGGKVDNVLSTIQQAWVTADASQCGYCQPGRIMAATALLKSNSNPSVPEIQTGLEGILCRCGTYVNVIQAVQAAAKSLGGV